MNQQPPRSVKNAQDQRVRRTYHSLISALEEYLCESTQEEISVKQICERAGIQRTTFYQHFRDIQDFSEWYILQKQNEVRSIASTTISAEDERSAFFEIANSTMRFLKQNEKLIKSLMNKRLNGKHLVELYVNTCVDEMKAKLKDLRDADEASGRTPIAFLAEFYVGGMISAFRWWIVNDHPVTEEEFMHYLHLRVERMNIQ